MSPQHWIIPVGIALVCIIIAVAGEAGREALRYLGPVVDGGGFSHRWLTGHLTHLGWGHVALNLAGLVGVWAVYGRMSAPCVWIAVLLVCPFAISVGLHRLSPEIVSYVGASGVLHGLLAFGALANMAGTRNTVLAELLVFAGLWAKIAFEQWGGPVPMTAQLSGGAVVVDAHLYGAGTGSLLGLIAVFTKSYPRLFRLR